MKRIVGQSLFVLTAMLLVLSGCTEKKETTAQDVKRSARVAAETVRDYTAEQRAQYVGVMMDTLKSYEKDMKQLEMKAEQMSDETRAEMEKHLEVLREKHDELAERLEEMRTSTGNAWMDLKTGADQAADEMSKAYKKANAEFE